MVSAAQAEALRQAQEGVRSLVVRDLNAFWVSLDLYKPEAARDALLEFTRVLVAAYGESAASVAADWYDEVRAAGRVPGRFRAQMVVPDESVAMAETVHRVAGGLFTDDPSGVLLGLVAAAPKYVLAAARQTIVWSTVRDPRASGWERVVRPDACRFCRMLRGRGAVYKESTVDFAAHKSCNCAAAPSWDLDAPEVDVRLYEASMRTSRMSPAQRESHTEAVREALDRLVPVDE